MTARFSVLSCGVENWHAVWGDPWMGATFLVLGYLAAAVLSFRAAAHSPETLLFWQIIAALMLVQAVNTPLDLHALVWNIGKCAVAGEGWNTSRQLVRQAVVLAVLISLFLVGAFFVRRFSFQLMRYPALCLGLLVILSTLALRVAAATLPRVANLTLEAAGLALVIFALIRLKRRHK